MHKIYTADNPVTAHLIRGILEAQGIIAEVKGEALFSVRGELPMVGETFPTVWVVETGDVERALDIVQEYDTRQQTSKVTPVTWQCQACGELLEEQFSTCWKCGKDREDA